MVHGAHYDELESKEVAMWPSLSGEGPGLPMKSTLRLPPGLGPLVVLAAYLSWEVTDLSFWSPLVL